MREIRTSGSTRGERSLALLLYCPSVANVFRRRLRPRRCVASEAGQCRTQEAVGVIMEKGELIFPVTRGTCKSKVSD